jgi:hypothetical protein
MLNRKRVEICWWRERNNVTEATPPVSANLDELVLPSVGDENGTRPSQLGDVVYAAGVFWELLPGPLPEHLPALQSDFREKYMYESEHRVAIYSVVGHETKIHIPQDYDDSLVAEDRWQRLAPKDIPALLDQLPNDIVKEIHLLDIDNPLDRWMSSTLGEPFRAAAEASVYDRKITWYNALGWSWVEVELNHEWAHLLEEHSRVRHLYNDAVRVEQRSWDNADVRTSAEDWATHLGEGLMARDPLKVVEVARQAPVRTLLLADVLEAATYEQSESAERPIHEIYRKRARLATTIARPAAITSLLATVNTTADQRDHISAARLLAGYGTPEEMGHIARPVDLQLWDQQWVTDKTLKEIASIPNIRTANLAATNFTTRGLGHLITTSIVSLSVASNHLHDFAGRYLSQMSHTTHLDISHNRFTDAAVDDLAKMTQLKDLRVYGNFFSEEGIDALKNALPDAHISG